MIQPDRPTLLAMHRLLNTHDWATVEKWLLASKEEIQAGSNRQPDEVKVRWAQGKVQFIDEFVTQLAQARTHLEAIEKSKDEKLEM